MIQEDVEIDLRWAYLTTENPREVVFLFYMEWIHQLPCGQQIVCDQKEKAFDVTLRSLSSDVLREEVTFMLSHFEHLSSFSVGLNEEICKYVSEFGPLEAGHGLVKPMLQIGIRFYTELIDEEEEEDEAEEVLIEEEMEDALELPFDEEEEMDEILELSLVEDLAGGGFGGVPASSSSIKKLEKMKYATQKEGFEEVDKACTICFEDFDVGLEVTKMPCSHIFHSHCIVQWLEGSHLCPLCRFKMPTESEDNCLRDDVV